MPLAVRHLVRLVPDGVLQALSLVAARNVDG